MNFVQPYKSSDVNAPIMVGVAGAGLYMLDACLVNGYGSPQQINSITLNGTIATVTVPSTANLLNGQRVTIAGASVAGANITAAITVTSGTAFTYPCGATGAVTGTLTFTPILDIASITRVGDTATVTFALPNVSVATGDYRYITIAGADQPQYNGTFEITPIDTTHATFTVAGTPPTPATGTLTYCKAGLGWSRPFSKTNVAAYRSQNVVSNRFYLRVDDAQNYFILRGYESMSDIDTGTGLFPTASQGAIYQRKSNTLDATTVRAWALAGDDKTFYMNCQANPATGYDFYMMGFGHFISHRPSDLYNTFLAGATIATAGGVNAWQYFSGAPGYQGGGGWPGGGLTSVMMARSYTQMGLAFGAMALVPFASNTNNGGTSGAFGASTQAGVQFHYPNAADLGFYVAPIFLSDGLTSTATQCIRGRLPGIYAPLMGCNPSYNPPGYETFAGVVQPDGTALTKLTIMVATSNQSAGFVAMDTIGPWN